MIPWRSRSVDQGGTGAGYTKENVKLAHWKAVMQHGLAKYRVGRYDAGDECAEHPSQPRILLDLPADGDKKLMAEFHNRLMLLCQLPIRQAFRQRAATPSEGSAGWGRTSAGISWAYGARLLRNALARGLRPRKGRQRQQERLQQAHLWWIQQPSC